MSFLTKRYVTVRELGYRWCKGQTTAEYAVVTAAVAVAAIAAYSRLGTEVSTKVGRVNAVFAS